MIPYGRQDINEDDIQSVINVLKSDFLTQGQNTPKFEAKLAEYCNVKSVFAMNSATSALHVACRALDLQPNDWLWTSPISFVASSNCGLYCGANIDFVDIDPVTYNMSADALREKLEVAETEGRLPKIVIPVHLCGQSCDMEEISALSDQYGFKIIEDASHAIGGLYKESRIGDCRYSDVTIFSFHPVKIVTTAEGGVACTNDPAIADKMSLLRSHGITRDSKLMSKEPDGSWYYEQIELGYNYRMTELQAALGVSQLDRIDQFIEKRHQIANRYDDEFQNLPLVTPKRLQDRYSALHLYVIRVRDLPVSHTHKTVFEQLRQSGIGVNLHYIPIYRQPYYKKFGFKQSSFPEAEAYYSEAISLPMFPSMTDEQQSFVIQQVKKIYQT